MTMAEHTMTRHELIFRANTKNDLSRSIDAWDKIAWDKIAWDKIAWDKIAKYTEPNLKAAGYYQEEDRAVNEIVK